jgi:hypothetical protein
MMMMTVGGGDDMMIDDDDDYAARRIDDDDFAPLVGRESALVQPYHRHHYLLPARVIDVVGRRQLTKKRARRS